MMLKQRSHSDFSARRSGFPHSVLRGLPWDVSGYCRPVSIGIFGAITVDDKAVGSIGVFRNDNIHSRTAEMGYYVSEP